MPRKKINKPKPKIKDQEILVETTRKSYEVLRLSRVKYEDNPETFIDLRIFQKSYEYNEASEDDEGLFPTKKGVQLKEAQFQRLIGKWTLVPTLLFHPLIIEKAYPALTREEYDTAVFRAYKAIEIRVRERSGLPQTVIGTDLMRKAFDPDN